MSPSSTGASAQAVELPRACVACRRRSWLLSTLSPSLDYHAGDRARLNELLSLGEEDLVQALGGSRRAELRARLQTLGAAELADAPSTLAICRHCDAYPRTLCEAGAPWMLNVVGDWRALQGAQRSPVVAILGSRRASDYGLEMSRCLARGLAASGVTVACELLDGIGAAALGGALEGGGSPLVIAGAGLGVCCPGRRRALLERVRRRGCALSELGHECRGRRWGAVAAERTLARLACMAVVVEAEQRDAALGVAVQARALGRTLAAMPGRVTSRLSGGTHALLIEGASLVRGAEDVLELLCLSGVPPTERAEDSPGPHSSPLERRLAEVLAQVGAGRDTLGKLASLGTDEGELLLALTELELTGALARGDGGRYVCRRPVG